MKIRNFVNSAPDANYLEIKQFSDRIEWYTLQGDCVMILPKFDKQSVWLSFVEEMFLMINDGISNFDKFNDSFYMSRFYSWKWCKRDLRSVFETSEATDKKTLLAEAIRFINGWAEVGVDVTGWAELAERYCRNYKVKR